MPGTASCSIMKARDFVTRKIARHSPHRDRPKSTLYLGNFEARRDWGHVRGDAQDPQADLPNDFVLATGEARSVREFVARAFAEVGRSIEWRGKGADEIGVDCKSGKTIRIDPVYPAYRSRSSDASK